MLHKNRIHTPREINDLVKSGKLMIQLGDQVSLSTDESTGNLEMKWKDDATKIECYELKYFD